MAFWCTFLRNTPLPHVDTCILVIISTEGGTAGPRGSARRVHGRRPSLPVEENSSYTAWFIFLWLRAVYMGVCIAYAPSLVCTVSCPGPILHIEFARYVTSNTKGMFTPEPVHRKNVSKHSRLHTHRRLHYPTWRLLHREYHVALLHCREY